MDFPALGAPTPVPSPISRPVPSPVAIPVPSTVSSPVSRPVPSTIPSSVPSTVQIKNEPVANPNSSTGAVPKQGNLSRVIDNILVWLDLDTQSILTRNAATLIMFYKQHCK